MKIGYARVSSTSQNLENQISSLKKIGCEKIFAEKISGAKVDRKEFKAMMEFARENDKIHITRLDRLSRSSLELQKTTQELENKKIDLVVLEQDIDTSTSIGKLLFNIIAVVAEFERATINERASEGRKVAMEKGIKFGRKKSLSRDEIKEIKQLILEGVSKADIAKRFNVGRTTIYRSIQENHNKSKKGE